MEANAAMQQMMQPPQAEAPAAPEAEQPQLRAV
jgi:hypothetical protein